MSEVEWGPLNPARGDKGPRAGALWGDRNAPGPSGFLVRFVDGFSSPSHIHNVSYRGVVVSGLVHNDDPEAADMWMSRASYWTQPAGEAHITAAKGSVNLAYIEIEEGPYLVLPTEKAFDNGERPVNLEAKNIVWLNASNLNWIDAPGTSDSANGPKLAFLWGKPQADELNGSFIKLPAGFTGRMSSQASSFHAVVIQGQARREGLGDAETRTLEPGSYFGSKGTSEHRLSCVAEEACIIYVRVSGKYAVIPALQ
ncbi:MAG: DUF4437 domain-containing protein [Candidatus Nitrohelix vancouverensis]|uniref:DUF4437 domain-containing protein n=1 Tax=Candidatus Nitrohelix vancouverensis TaxID=2705534 RepID=A0A7T0C5M9_9BACT|nr:MAG: DUF4437 domain-containing protein [Candidatus Nitrohelix vancouverensis]